MGTKENLHGEKKKSNKGTSYPQDLIPAQVRVTHQEPGTRSRHRNTLTMRGRRCALVNERCAGEGERREGAIHTAGTKSNRKASAKSKIKCEDSKNKFIQIQ